MFAFGLQFSALLPGWLILILAAALAGAVFYGTALMLRKNLPPRWTLLLTGLRLVVVALFVLALLQPVASAVKYVQPLPEALVLVDASRSMALPSNSSGKDRLQEAAGWLQEGEFAAALRSRFGLDWYRFDQAATRLEAGDMKTLEAKGTGTDIGASLADALEQLHAQGKSPQRVVLVSDGNERGTADAAEAALRFGVAVDVLAPTALRAADKGEIEIADVQGARRVLLGSETHFRLTLTRTLPIGKDQPLTLVMQEDGQKVKDWSVPFKAGAVEQTVTLAHRPPVTGTKAYTFQIQGQAGPTAKFVSQIVDSKFEILVLEDTWRWEYKFLHRLFEDDPSFRFTALLPRGNKAFVQFGSPDRRVNLIGVPQSRSDLEGFDLFFLGDVNPSKWSPGLAQSLAQLVAEEGKSLVVIAGPNLGRLADIPELHALLPVDLTRESSNPTEGPVDVQLRPDAVSSPFFFQLRSGESEKPPPLDRVYPALRKRAGATVLLEAVKHRNAYGNLIVLAEQTVGRGRVLFVGTDTLWKWHTLAADKEGPTPYTIFWQQALRTMTPQRLRLGPVNLWLTPSRTRSDAGQRLEIEAEVQADRPLPQTKVQATVALPDGKRLPLSFAVDPAQPRRFRAEFVPPTPGVYAVSASVSSEGKPAAEGNTVLQVDEPRGETTDVGIDRAYLQRLAATTGGQVIDPARPETWPAAAETSLPPVERRSTVDLWNNFSLLLLLCALLGLDWFIRLYNGFV